MKPYVLANKINSILRDNKYDRYVSGKTRGKLDYNSLSKISYSGKIFKKKEARKNKDYKVIVLADASGSMVWDNKHLTCANSLQLVSEALEMTDVEYAIWSFSGDILSLKDFSEKAKAEGVIKKLYLEHFDNRYVYGCLHCNTAFGSFDEKLKACIICDKPFTNRYKDFMRETSSSYNADGLAVHLAMESIQKLSGKHVVIILSDGQADCIPWPSMHYMDSKAPTYKDFPLRKVVERIKKTDTILCSIGIMSNDVNNFYPKENTVVIKSQDLLGNTLVSLIKKQIKRG